MRASGHESREVRHVDEVKSTNLVCNLPHARKINDAWIRAAATDDHLGALFFGEALQLIVVDGFRFFCHSIGDDLISLPRKIQMVSMGEMAAVSQVETKDGVARLENRRVGLHVCLRTCVGLHG